MSWRVGSWRAGAWRAAGWRGCDAAPVESPANAGARRPRRRFAPAATWEPAVGYTPVQLEPEVPAAVAVLGARVTVTCGKATASGAANVTAGRAAVAVATRSAMARGVRNPSLASLCRALEIALEA